MMEFNFGICKTPCKVYVRLMGCRHLQWTSLVRPLSVSAVTTTDASTAMSCVILSMTAVTVLMRGRKTVSRVFESKHLRLLYIRRKLQEN